MRRAPKVDANQQEIVAALRAVGAGVRSLAAVGQDFPDLVAGFRGVNFLLEVKDGGKKPSKRRLTEGQARFHALWPGRIDTVTSVEEALKAIGAVNDL